MRTALCVVGWLTVALAMPGMAAASAADVFHRLGLFGTWAVHCATPPSIANPYVIYRLSDGNRVQRQISVAPGKIVELSTIAAASEAGQTELIISWQTSQGGITNRILLGNGWMQVQDSTRDNGEKLFVKGRRVRDNAEAPRFVRCATGESASIPQRGTAASGSDQVVGARISGSA